ncbi:hypothetical protein [Nocardia terpenica]|uniref:Uncharacterized protein n=1 Tax=Nocardia terpenica TaxID=455432 RepID=A0A291RNR6_9NOCA|nr:hypothetical protein [Nocardia terpenica]ATL68975.1 hypothetical protein CRH09_25120 [Nocardia terpenica]
MNADDPPSVESDSDGVFFDSDRHDLRVGEPEPRSEGAAKRWIGCMRYFLEVDPHGRWVATEGEQIVGFGISQNRDCLWHLASGRTGRAKASGNDCSTPL